MDLISIIIPVYNSEKYLKQCLDSVCQQTYPELEIILIDDGSTDGSGNICRCYASNDSRIKLVCMDNGGEASARKAGLKASTGKMITFVDSDDWLKADAVERLYKEMETQNVDIVVADFIELREGKEKVVKGKLAPGVYRGQQLKSDIFSKMLCCAEYFEMGIGPYLWNKMFRRETIEPVLSKLNEKLVVGVDAVCTFPSLLRAGAISIMPEAFYHYRIHSASIMHRFRTEEEEAENIKIQYRELRESFGQSEYRDILFPQMERYILHHFMVRAVAFLEKELNAIGMSLVCGMVHGSKIVLYGAGIFGTSLYYAYERSKDLDIVGWCDRNYKEIQKMGYPVISLQGAIGKPFDYIMIAVLNEKIKNQIWNDLLMEGVAEEKIRWIDTNALEQLDLEQVCR